jgi:hypothetical protein
MFSISQFAQDVTAAMIDKITHGKPGHTRRRLRPVYRQAEQQLAAQGFTDTEIRQFVSDCKDMAYLEIQAED